MYSVSSPMALAVTLLLASLCGQASGFPRSFERQERQLTCILDQFGAGFSAEPQLATPYCRSYLALPAVTTTRTRTVTIT